MQIRRSTLSTLGASAALGTSLGIVALTAGAAGAHVTVMPDTTAAGAYAVLTFSVGHGCEGSPTTKLAIQMPESIPVVTPTVNPNWTVEKVDEQLAEPVTDAHGNEITERTAQVVYTAKAPLPDGFRDTVALSVQLPEAAGDTLAFPVVQTCEKGETGWTETAAEGQDPEELGSPAPVLTVTEATGEGHHGGAATDGDAEDGAADGGADAKADEASDDGGNGLAVGGLVAGLGGLALGGLALARSGKKG
ncbi:YcnI family protein [Nocardioides sp. LHD-245]|uniref:YcnI family copper-binding membrane protein n=1 Tax=Nocardioides sp. LHD-245 TaxID=3051387 RepID=UPI0027DEF450|nr:YcnI family protein [Nocardioides sp. LHD-245]